MLDEAPGRDDPPQPDLLEGRARGRSASTAARRCAPGSVTRFIKAGDGRDRRRLRRRALGPLLLPRQLPGRLGPHRRARRARAAVDGRACRCRELRKPFERYAASGEINTEVGRPARRDRARWPPRFAERRARTASTGSPSTSATGGSTCGRPTPSRCCASTSRRPTAADVCRRSVAEVRALDRRRRLHRHPSPTDHRRRPRHGPRPPAARDPRLPRGQGPAALLRGRGLALQPAPQAALRHPRRHPRHADRRGRDGRRRRARAARSPRPRPRASSRRSRPDA